MGQNQQKKTVAIVFLTCQVLLYLILQLTRGSELVGAVAFTLGTYLVAIITFLLLYFQKIKKVGTIIGASIQILGAIGNSISTYLALEYENWFGYGVVAGILTNIPLLFAFVFLYQGTVNEKKKIAVSVVEENDIANNFQASNPEAMEQGHFNFSNQNEQVKKQYRKIFSVSDDERVILIGDVKSKGISLSYGIATVLFWIAYMIISVLTYSEETHGGVLSRTTEYRILGFEIASKHHLSENFSFSDELTSYIVFSIVIFLIPVFFYLFKRWEFSTIDLMLTEKKIYVCGVRSKITEDNIEKVDIPLECIKNIDCRPNFYINKAQNIIITKTTDEVIKIPSVRNANTFVSALIEEYKRIGE